MSITDTSNRTKPYRSCLGGESKDLGWEGVMDGYNYFEVGELNGFTPNQNFIFSRQQELYRLNLILNLYNHQDFTQEGRPDMLKNT